MPDKFHNPYNFIPALPRTTAQGTELGDREPDKHDRYHPERYSGRITVTMTTETPLLIPDAARATGTDHKTYPLRVVNGKPYLAPTSIKGMLRSEYEMITNSRLSVFSHHDDRLAYRWTTNITNIRPARVIKFKDGREALKILGHSVSLQRYRKQAQPNQRDKGQSKQALTYQDSSELPQHGDWVWVKLSADLQNASLSKVKEICRRAKGEMHKPGWYAGFVCITGANIKDKVNERVFIETPDDPYVPLTAPLKVLWKELITNYQEEHKQAIAERLQQGLKATDYLGSNPGETAFSRHVYTPEAAELKPGTLCYIKFKDVSAIKDAGRKGKIAASEVTALIPVMISRRLFETAPQALLDESLKSALTRKQLSPADRVFGWVNSSGQGAYRGNLRIYDVRCLDENAIESCGQNGLTLAILGQPKEQQARFYLAKAQSGEALKSGTPKEKGYQPGQALRGRKVYPHQTVPEGYWNPNTTEPIDGFYREYRQVDGLPSTQNRTIKDWVKSNTRFQFDIELTNFSAIELGALLWLLSLPEGQFHRLGGGKPFGFGSVKLEITKLQIQTGKDWVNYYRSLRSGSNAPKIKIEPIIKRFKDEVRKAYKKPFEDVSFIAAFSRATQGHNQPVHYPRTTKAPQPEGESFKWFVDNERGKRLALPDLVKDQGLPYSPRE